MEIVKVLFKFLPFTNKKEERDVADLAKKNKRKKKTLSNQFVILTAIK